MELVSLTWTPSILGEVDEQVAEMEHLPIFFLANFESEESLNVSVTWRLRQSRWTDTLYLDCRLFSINCMYFLNPQKTKMIDFISLWTRFFKKNPPLFKDVRSSWTEPEAAPPQNVLDLDRTERPGPAGRYHSATAGVHLPGARSGQEQRGKPLGQGIYNDTFIKVGVHD